jgi:hypothetical protein
MLVAVRMLVAAEQTKLALVVPSARKGWKVLKACRVRAPMVCMLQKNEDNYHLCKESK